MTNRPRLVGINHVALEVGDLEAALELYGRLFDFELRGRAPGMAFVDLGDQFIAFAERDRDVPDGERHFGLVVDDLEAARASLDAAGLEILAGRGVNFRDPWGNRVEVVDYRDVQFSKTPSVLRGMGLELEKRPEAVDELRAKRLADRSAPG